MLGVGVEVSVGELEFWSLIIPCSHSVHTSVSDLGMRTETSSFFAFWLCPDDSVMKTIKLQLLDGFLTNILGVC